MKATNIKIAQNTNTGGVCAFFGHDGYEFYADLSFTWDAGNECMIFPSKNKQVTSWRELYCKRGIDITKENLLACIQDFINKYDGKQ